MANKSNTKCLCCREIFTADVRNRGRQKYCAKAACRAAAKAARQRRWQQKPQNQDYFCGPIHVQRVRQWRQAHPGYWRRHHRAPSPLQDALVSQPIEQTDLFDGSQATPAPPALQDALSPLDPVLIGLIAHLTDSTLQDSIAVTVRRLLQLGQDILSGGGRDARQTGATS
jgi:hypothetical protein